MVPPHRNGFGISFYDNWKRTFFFVWLSQFLSIAGFSLVFPFIPIYVRDKWGISGEHELGIWMSAFYFFGMLSYCGSTPLWGVLADRYGRKLMLLRACYVDGFLFPCFLLARIRLVDPDSVHHLGLPGPCGQPRRSCTNTPEEHHGFCLGPYPRQSGAVTLRSDSRRACVTILALRSLFSCVEPLTFWPVLATFLCRRIYHSPQRNASQGGKSVPGFSTTAWISLRIVVMALEESTNPISPNGRKDLRSENTALYTV